MWHWIKLTMAMIADIALIAASKWITGKEPEWQEVPQTAAAEGDPHQTCEFSVQPVPPRDSAAMFQLHAHGLQPEQPASSAISSGDNQRHVNTEWNNTVVVPLSEAQEYPVQNRRGPRTVRKDVLIFHSDQDEGKARVIKQLMIDRFNDGTGGLSIEVYADEGIGKGKLSYLDKILSEFLLILCLIGPGLIEDEVHLFQLETLKLQKLQDNDKAGRVAMLCYGLGDNQIQKVHSWLGTHLPVKPTKYGLLWVKNQIIKFREIIP